MSEFSISCPIKYFEDNLIFNSARKECWAAYKMEGFNYDFRSNQGKISILNALARFIANIGIEAQVLIVPSSQDIEAHYKRLLKKLNKKDNLFSVAKAHAEQTSWYLKKNIQSKGNANDYKVYILTKLSLKDDVIREIKYLIEYFVKEPFQMISEMFSVENRDILEREIDSFSKLANEYMRKQSRRIEIEKCTSLEVQWLIRRPFYRGLGDFSLRGDEENMWTPFAEKILRSGEAYVRPNEREILTLADGILDVEEGRVLKVVHPPSRVRDESIVNGSRVQSSKIEEQVSYQAFLAISDIPDLDFPDNNEWLLALQDFPIQTEVCIKISTKEHKESLRNIDKKRKELKDQIEHIVGSDEALPEELSEGMEYANVLEAELKATRSPMSHTSIFLCIASSDKDELEDRVATIKEWYEDFNFMVQRPVSDQLKLFMEFLPGSPQYVTDYVQKLPPRTLAGSMFGATRLLGDNVGPYIGTTGSLKKKVFLDIARACLLNKSASGGFFGTLGGGKSFLANLLFYLSVLYGAYGLILDPKGERSNWVDDLPEFAGNINIITLSSKEEDKGKLDPFLIYRDDLEQAGSLAFTIMNELFNFKPNDDGETAVLEAIKKTKEHENPCMLTMTDILCNFPEDDELRDVAKKIGRKTQFFREMAMAGLLFGNGTEKGLSFDKRINIVQIQNLSMPAPNKPKEEYTKEEQFSTILMIPIASFARKFIHQDRRYFKITLFDEAWALKATAGGKQMMNSLIREGRALYAGCFFISQSTEDADGEEGLKNNISYKFCFRSDDNKEIKNILSFLNLEITSENMDTVRNLENGQCLFQDLSGRVGVLKVDGVFEHLIEKAFNTNPEKAQKNDEQSA